MKCAISFSLANFFPWFISDHNSRFYRLRIIIPYVVIFTKLRYAILSKETPGHKVAVVQFYINRIFKIDDVEQLTHLDFYLKGALY